MSRFTTRCDADHRSLSDLRGRLTSWLLTDDTGPLLPGPLVADIDVVVTELGANVIDHTGSPWLQVSVDVGLDVVVLEASHIGSVHAIPPAESWGLLQVGDRGRGLRIVRALTRHIEIVGDDHRASVRCEMDVS